MVAVPSDGPPDVRGGLPKVHQAGDIGMQPPSSRGGMQQRILLQPILGRDRMPVVPDPVIKANDENIDGQTLKRVAL